MKSDLKQALKFSIQSINNQYHKTLLTSLEPEILEGTSFEKALKATGIFSPMELLRIGLAEKSAKLPNTFKSLFNDNTKKLSKMDKSIGPIVRTYCYYYFRINNFFRGICSRNSYDVTTAVSRVGNAKSS